MNSSVILLQELGGSLGYSKVKPKSGWVKVAAWAESGKNKASKKIDKNFFKWHDLSFDVVMVFCCYYSICMCK